jgi:polyisoprenoid-binding protein YceI
MNMKTIGKIALIAFILASAGLTTAIAQNPVLIKDESSITISGTSSLHDWHEKAEDFKVEMELNSGKGSVPVISNVLFSCKVTSITSESSLMTSKTHDAFRADKYPEILFWSDGQAALASGSDAFSTTIKGRLYINGVKKQVTVPVEARISGDELMIRGSRSLNMIDYSIKPPTAILGTLKTGEEITVTFDLKFRLPASNMILSSINK